MVDAPLIRVLSLGAGVQSTTVALMIEAGEIPPVAAAIFADTVHEPRKVYAHLEWLRSRLSYPVHVVSQGDLWESATRLRTRKDGNKAYLKTALPVFTFDGVDHGRNIRQCTADFKIEPIQREIRRLLGRPRISSKAPVLVEVLIGISVDEAQRMKPARFNWIKNVWPLIDRNMDRQGCLEWMEGRGYPIPPRSACTFWPHHDDGFWLDMEPEEFADVCAKERALQVAYEASGSFSAVPFFHRSCVPLSEVTLVRPPHRASQRLLDFGAECEGMCGV
jgi:hypothetical protein